MLPVNSQAKADSQLIADLHQLSRKAPTGKLVKSSTYPAPSSPGITVRSWKMNEHKYYDVPSPFPTLARGIFSVEEEDGSSRIVARGYDKFFNIGEVPWTTWSSLEAHTVAPYTLSLKSNGCIIFISALTPTKLLICSKHSIGPVAGSPESHAEAGERWLKLHLEEKGKSTEQLAATLWDKNWTAVAELCDDLFEEHVLPYPPEKSGLHLHGINESGKAFRTQTADIVDAFAAEWGFFTTITTTLNSIPEVQAFTSQVAKTGKWNGEALEGFVVRTHISTQSTNGRDTKSVVSPPYPPGASFFFKVKFDEPYMMYRDWREVTKALLSTKGPLHTARIPKSKLKRPETKLYVKWVTEEIKSNRAAFSEYTKGKGIIRTRERFLEWMAGADGKKGLKDTSQNGIVASVKDETKTFGKTIIVPVAIPGCGKILTFESTSIVELTLVDRQDISCARFIGFGHTQSDDVKGKKTAPTFIKNVVNLLQTSNVVIADKNNHLRQHRDALRVATAKMSPPVRLLALNWSLDKPPSTIHRICADRVCQRGDKHQSLRADTVAKSHEEVIWQFITNMEELSDSEVDVSVDMDLEDTPEQALDRAIEACVSVLGVERPAQEKVKEALEIVQGYAPKVTRAHAKKESKAGMPRYFGLLAEVDLVDVIQNRLDSPSDSQPDMTLWQTLISNDRVAKRPHVTIVHSKSLSSETELWERCMAIHRLPIPPLFKFELGTLIWNDRVMAATVDDIRLDDQGGLGQEGQEFISKLPHDVRERLHITVGTRRTDVKPVEGKSLVEEWRSGKDVYGVHVEQLEGLLVKGRIKGMCQ